METFQIVVSLLTSQSSSLWIRSESPKELVNEFFEEESQSSSLWIRSERVAKATTGLKALFVAILFPLDTV